MRSLWVNQLKKGYSLYVSQLSKKAAQKQLKSEIVYLLSFPNNNQGLVEALSKEYPVKVCYTKEGQLEAEKLKELGIPIIPIATFTGLKQTITAVTQSKLVIADNYFAFLADIKKRAGQAFFQIWHATGAIKQFGLEDKATKKRSVDDKKRFQRVYDSFDYYVVASKKMGEVFKRSYGAKEEQMLYLGFPRTDALLRNKKNKPANHKKKKVVYLPTYRESDKTIDYKAMIQLIELLGDDYALYIKTHPHVTIEKNEALHPNIYIVDPLKSADNLLLEADSLLTDYSSVAFDYALIHPEGQLLFYWYDEISYQKRTGIQPIIKKSVSSDICYTIEEVARQIKRKRHHLEAFNEQWNTYNDGFATDRLLMTIKEKMG